MSNQKIKCLYITFTGLTDPLGQSQVLPYIEDLSRKGINFCLISLEKKKDKREIKNLETKLENLGIEWYRLKYFKYYFIGMVLNIFQCFFLSSFLIIYKKIKIIHARSYPPLFSVLLLKKILGLKLIFDMRGFWPEELVDSGRIKEKSIYYKILKFLETKSILLSDWIVTLTPEAKEIITEKFKVKNIEWMPTCVDINKFETKDRVSFGDKFVMVYSGSLWSFYNMDGMADFFKILKSKINNAHFLILGNNESERIKSLFLKKGIENEDYTVLTLNPEDVAKYLSSSNLAISFIYDTYSKKASFPTKIAEYIASGLPVVINTQSNFLKNLIISNRIGVVVDKFDRKSYDLAIDSLKAILEKKETKERCKSVGKEYLSKGVCIDKYLEIYQSLR